MMCADQSREHTMEFQIFQIVFHNVFEDVYVGFYQIDSYGNSNQSD